MPVLPLVEVVPSLHTAPETVGAVEDFATRTLGKTVIRSQDRAGFVVNALLIPYLLSAVRMTESGFASAADVDTGMELGCAHPMGPLKLADLIGLDTIASIAESPYDEFKNPSTRRPRSSSGWWRQGCWAARPAAGSTCTARSEHPGRDRAGGPGPRVPAHRPNAGPDPPRRVSAP